MMPTAYVFLNLNDFMRNKKRFRIKTMLLNMN